jgi:hypothetical protein
MSALWLLTEISSSFRTASAAAEGTKPQVAGTISLGKGT